MIKRLRKYLDLELLWRILSFAGPYKPIFYLTFSITIIIALVAPVRPYLIKIMVDEFIPSHDTDSLLRYSIFLVLILLAESLAQYFQIYFANLLGQSIIRDLRVKLYRKLIHFKLSFFDKTPIGTLVTRTVSDIETIAEVFSHGVISIFGEILKIFVVVGAMFFINWKLALFSLSPIPLLIVATYIFKNAVKKAYEEVRTQVSVLNTFVQEHLVGISIVQAFNREAREMKKFEDFLDNQGDVKNPQSVADLIEKMNDVMGEGKIIPDSREKITNLWFLLEGEDIMSQLVNSDYTEAVIQATIISIDTKRISRLVSDIQTYIDNIDNSNFTFTQTGMHIIYKKLDDSMMKSQVQSLIIALVLIFLIMTFQMHSISGGLIGLIPIFFTLASIFGVMGYFKIPLDIATVLVGSISIGIGIDYSIHFINRFKKEFQQNHNESEALEKTLETTGRAIVINVATVMLGFLVLIFANLIPLQRFGILVAITMIGSGIGAITLLPAVILITKAKFVGDWSEMKNGILNKTGSVIKKTKLKK